ncbi:Lipid A 3-O-deacylase (PagL) [Devosia enhydra]|uniref:Lipid A 3-O-deacylase (PagL) n=1 Tax=Devosia enhydra TaxID=665118 RepID=A0A1K2I3A9_9HYPH|nr:acyloxyacyl hydrolase [Devosia enhydra]SFZ86244.1 Lipid A 3-O-deacylase (PagL) [Devosia enhydra]
MKSIIACIAMMASTALSGAAIAQDAAQWLLPLEEVRVGGAISSVELIPYSIFVPEVSSFDISNLDTVTFEALFRLPDIAAFQWLGSPRIELGGVLNLRGRESVAHAGLNWHVPVFETPLFLEMGWGIGIHDAALEGATAPYRNVGCNPLVHWSLSAGAEIDPNWSVIARLQHVSHALLCGDAPNDGINNFGVSLGYRF